MTKFLLSIIVLLLVALGYQTFHQPKHYMVDDLNRDGAVNIFDMSKFLSNYKVTPAPVRP